MQKYQITLTGNSPLIMHHDNIVWADHMEEWKNDPDNKTKLKAGDDRSPAWRWLGCLYQNGENIYLPAANIMRCLMEAGAMVPTGGKGGKTFKSQTQSGMQSAEEVWTLLVNGGEISYRELKAEVNDENDFAKHIKAAQSRGFDLLIKRAKIGTSKHVRVRPIFYPGWVVKGSLLVFDEQITQAVLTKILEYAGEYKGLGDWRPGGKTPGPYGAFKAVVKKD
jgi:hypothetical protein